MLSLPFICRFTHMRILKIMAKLSSNYARKLRSGRNRNLEKSRTKSRIPASSNFPMYEMTSTYNLLPKR